jgi:hypothetical protein
LALNTLLKEKVDFLKQKGLTKVKWLNKWAGVLVVTRFERMSGVTVGFFPHS